MDKVRYLDETNLKPVHEALCLLSEMLKHHDYVAGKCLTVADLSLVATVSSIDVSFFEFITLPLEACDRPINVSTTNT